MDKPLSLFAKLTCCMLRIFKWIWTGLCATSFFSRMCSIFFQQRFRHVFQQSQTPFCCQTVFDVFGSCMLFLEKFMEKFLDVNGRRDVFEWIQTEFTQSSWSFCGRHQQACLHAAAATFNRRDSKYRRGTIMHVACACDFPRFVSCVEKGLRVRSEAAEFGFCFLFV